MQEISVREWLKANPNDDLNEQRVQCVAATGAKDRTVRKRQVEMYGASVGTRSRAAATVVGSMTEEELLNTFDKTVKIRGEIKDALDEVVAKGFNGQYCMEADLRTSIGFPGATPHTKAIFEMPEYDRYKFILDGKVFWTDPAQREHIITVSSSARRYVSRTRS